jgi:hypothetical protein
MLRGRERRGCLRDDLLEAEEEEEEEEKRDGFLSGGEEVAKGLAGAGENGDGDGGSSLEKVAGPLVF